jgi:hypothetical protein
MTATFRPLGRNWGRPRIGNGLKSVSIRLLLCIWIHISYWILLLTSYMHCCSIFLYYNFSLIVDLFWFSLSFFWVCWLPWIGYWPSAVQVRLWGGCYPKLLDGIVGPTLFWSPLFDHTCFVRTVRSFSACIHRCQQRRDAQTLSPLRGKGPRSRNTLSFRETDRKTLPLFMFTKENFFLIH